MSYIERFNRLWCRLFHTNILNYKHFRDYSIYECAHCGRNYEVRL